MESNLNLKTRVFTLPTEDGKTKKIEVDAEDVDYIFRGLRPRNMDYMDYKYIRIILKDELAQYLKGEVVHLSKVSDAVWANYTKGKNIKQKGQTYVKEKK